VSLVACELGLASFGTGLDPEIHCSRSMPYTEFNQAVPICPLDVAISAIKWVDVRYWHHPEVPPATKEGRLRLQSGLWQAIDGRGGHCRQRHRPRNHGEEET
jgi:hypothetical protein